MSCLFIGHGPNAYEKIPGQPFPGRRVFCTFIERVVGEDRDKIRDELA